MKDKIELEKLLDSLDEYHAAMNRDTSVYRESAMAIRLLALSVGDGDTAIRKLEDECERRRWETEDSRKAARWMLPFLINEPAHHLSEAVRRWPWLKEDLPEKHLCATGECTPTIKSKATNEKKFTCYYESVLTQIHDPTGRALTIGEIVELLNDRERLRLYERACESMAKQFICPKMTGEQLAKMQLGE